MVTQQIDITSPTIQDQCTFVVKIFGHVVKSEHLDFLCWVPEGDSEKGFAQWNSFIGIENSKKRKAVLLDDLEEDVELPSGSSFPAQTTQSGRPGRMPIFEPSAISLLRMSTYMQMKTTPNELLTWIAQDARDRTGAIADTYNWAVNAYDIGHPAHHLALYLSWVLNKMTPCTKVDATLTKSTKSPYYIPSRSAKAAKTKRTPSELNFGWYLLWIMAMLDPDSPWRQGIPPAKKGTKVRPMGKKWTDFFSTYQQPPILLLLQVTKPLCCQMEEGSQLPSSSLTSTLHQPVLKTSIIPLWDRIFFSSHLLSWSRDTIS